MVKLEFLFQIIPIFFIQAAKKRVRSSSLDMLYPNHFPI